MTASASGDPVLSVALIAVSLIGAWAVTCMSGGSKTSLPHAFYVPVIVAALRFGSRSALAAALVAGVAVGPLMPQDATGGIAQSPDNWLTRLAIFVVIGQLTAYLCRHSLSTLASEVAYRRFRREMQAARPRSCDWPINLSSISTTARWSVSRRSCVGTIPTGEWSPPGQFVADAEAAGCIGAVTRFVLQAACGVAEGPAPTSRRVRCLGQRVGGRSG